jgi:hypothetical protein
VATWGVPDWNHHDFCEAVDSLELPATGGYLRDRQVYRAGVAPLQR